LAPKKASAREPARLPRRLYRIRNMIEKPKPDGDPYNLAIIGRYILTPEISSHSKRSSPAAAAKFG
jgi:UTP--glucose-1-phosphate uridylyltransferase